MRSTPAAELVAGFQAIVKVTVDDKQIYHLDSGYLLGTAK